MGSPAGSAGSGLCPVDGGELLPHTNLRSGRFWLYENRQSSDIRRSLQVMKGKFGVEIGKIELVREGGFMQPSLHLTLLQLCT